LLHALYPKGSALVSILGGLTTVGWFGRSSFAGLIGLGLFGVAIGFFCLLVPVKLIVRLLASKAKTTVRTGLDRWAAEL